MDSAIERLSVLDQSPISEGSTGSRALRQTIELAMLVERLGYHRYWVSEHHGGPMLAGPSPEALIGPIASATSRMRIGSGGVMLPHYSPFKVAESFSLLAGLFPERIDLGIGRAAGTDPMTAHALQRDRRPVVRSSPDQRSGSGPTLGMPDDFPQQLAELLAYLDDRLPPGHPFARLAKALPGAPEKPEPWLLGSSPQSAMWAGETGLPYAFADFINPNGAEIAQLYRDRFVDSEHLLAPQLAVAAWAVAADTEEEAGQLASSSQMAMRELRAGRLIAVPPVEKAMRYLERRAENGGAPGSRRLILGTGQQVRAGLEELAGSYGADEVIVVTITHDPQARRHSYELIADAFGLGNSDVAAPSGASAS
ncbi:MAG: LLM class flavin-dependent oxidoreductase [Thermoleophilaceae bacterium]